MRSQANSRLLGVHRMPLAVVDLPHRLVACLREPATIGRTLGIGARQRRPADVPQLVDRPGCRAGISRSTFVRHLRFARAASRRK
jgi:hypothetical protein